MFLKEIFCQDKTIDSLQHAYAIGRMAHAYIFDGDDGVGKFTTARAWAKMLLCEDKQPVSDSLMEPIDSQCMVSNSDRISAQTF